MKKYFIFGAVCCFIAALLHIGCIIFGPDWYRFLGAGEQMASMAEAGHIEPTIVTSIIALVLMVWGLYGLSAAGIVFRLPLQKLALGLISGVLIFRALAFPVLMPSFPENSLSFWIISSLICLVMGASFAIGTWTLIKSEHKTS
ncbi:hypothetical protein [Pseudoalteromonas luteoviolacea]|uniref:hypothetical protein n=1 Tax=Pseudoalteromonas luteoviolacea TaxID=43657 RepID=UPI001153C6DE|nr:hypothetical protein [Pseudoalteromonas luteoviolacea]TQF71051.1 hypothetical protein FLM44_08175 [Pseudoalteromonas luteoviolacea]